MLHVRKHGHVTIAFVHRALVTIDLSGPKALPKCTIISEERIRKRSVLIWTFNRLWLREELI